METTLCPTCNSATSIAFNFCENCEAQINCLNTDCTKPLVPGKSICLYCGTSIVALSTKDNRGNSFSRYVEQTGEDYKEEIKIDMTDHAVSELAPFIAGQIVPRGPNGQPKHLRPGGKLEQQPASLPSYSEPENGFEPNTVDEQNAPEEIEVNPAASAQDYKVFEKDNGKLVAIEKDFKGSNFKEQLRRFVVLFTAAHISNFQKPVPGAKDYQQAAKQANLYNPKVHAPYFNATAKQFLTELSDGYKLNNDGEKELKKIINEMQSSSTASGFAYWEQNPSASAKAPVRFGKEDEAKVVGWIQDEVDLGKLQIGDLTKALDTLLVGIWILTVKLDKERAVRWVDVNQYLKRKFTTIKATGNAMSQVLGKSTSAKYIVKTGDLLYLNSEGKTLVEKWVSSGLKGDETNN